MSVRLLSQEWGESISLKLAPGIYNKYILFSIFDSGFEWSAFSYSIFSLLLDILKIHIDKRYLSY